MVKEEKEADSTEEVAKATTVVDTIEGGSRTALTKPDTATIMDTTKTTTMMKTVEKLITEREFCQERICQEEWV